MKSALNSCNELRDTLSNLSCISVEVTPSSVPSIIFAFLSVQPAPFDRQSYHHTQGENADKSSRSSDIACLPSDSRMLLAMVSVVATLAIHLETLSYNILSGDKAEDCRAYFFDCCVEIVVDNYCVILRSKSYLEFCFGKAFKNGLFRICGTTSQAFS